MPRLVVGLSGPLGAGKTRLVRAVAEGLQIADPNQVTSPTFVLIQEYSARLPIYHFDAYRLQSVSQFRELGADEYFADGGVCLIEWSDRVASALPDERWDIVLSDLGANRRTLQATCCGEEFAAAFDDWRRLLTVK